MNNGLPDKSVQLIIADPPYFEVKGDFDFIWKSFDNYLAEVEKWAKECKRILADNGTLFWYGSAKRIAYSQILLDKYFNLENSMVWRKIDSMQYQYYSPDIARSFNTHNERILMYSNEVGQTGLEMIMDEFIKPNHPFSAYLREEFDRAGVTSKEIAALFPSKTGGLTGCVSNWLNGDNVITEGQYNRIRDYLNGEFLRKEYEDLRKEYEDLRKEYEDQRRFFYNPKKYEDVLEFSQQGNVSKNYDHDTIKPEKLTTALILTCSRPGDIVFVPFSGSGTECAMAQREGRKYIGFDICKKYVDMGNERCKREKIQLSLFEPQETRRITTSST
jgi:site-specific DNA-methyltransferase (adenine-specific)